jgi:hypothetical protein
MARLSQQYVVPWPIAQRGHAWWAASCSCWPTGSSWKVQCETSKCPSQAPAQPVQHFTGTALANAGVYDVRGQRYAAANRPGVQVVDIDYRTYPLDLLTDFGKVHTVRCGFQ